MAGAGLSLAGGAAVPVRSCEWDWCEVTENDRAGQVTDNLSDDVPDYDGTQTGGPVRLSIPQAAALLGVNERTIRRRLAKPGKLPKGWTASLSGQKQSVLVLDSRTLNGLSGTAHGPSAVENPSDVTARAEVKALAELVAELRVQVAGLEGSLEARGKALEQAQAREAWLQGRVQALEAALERERDRAAEDRRELLSRIPLALPPARGFWQRIFRGKGEGSNG